MSEARERYEKRMSLLMAANDRETAIKDSVYIDYIIELEKACNSMAEFIKLQGWEIPEDIKEMLR